MPEPSTALDIGVFIFEGVDQLDVTGPLEVFTRLPDSRCRLYAHGLNPVRDQRGLRLIADSALDEAPQLDLLHVPGGPGQEALMEDEATLRWLRRQAAGARMVFSVCTGALLLGAAGLLKGRRATTHWASLELLPFFGALPVDERVVVDGSLISTAGVTAGLDGALRAVAALTGQPTAEAIQLAISYEPRPPFQSGSPDRAAPEILAQVRESYRAISQRRAATARRVAARLGVEPPAGARVSGS